MQKLTGKLVAIEQSKDMPDQTVFILGSLEQSGQPDKTRIAGQLKNPAVGAQLNLSGKFQDHPRHGYLFRFFNHSPARPVQQTLGMVPAKPADPANAADQGLVIEGELKSIRVQRENAENLSWVVASVKPTTEKEEILVVGEMINPTIGDSLRMTGEWKNHPQFGRQFAFQACMLIPPDTEEGILAALSSGRVKGIGPKLAARIVEMFGKDTFSVIENEPERLLEVPKIGQKKAEKICESYKAQQASMKIMAFLQEYGISPGFATKIYKKYGDDAVAVVKANPYRLAEDIHMVGFHAADKIAKAMGYADDSPYRVKAGVLYRLSETAKQGHTYYPFGPLTTETAEMLQVGTDLVREIIEKLDAERAAVEQAGTRWKDENRHKTFINIERIEGGCPADDPVGETRLMYCEIDVAARLSGLLDQAGTFEKMNADVDKEIADYEKKAGITLAVNQRQAVTAACEKKVCVLTGGPGTGKTTLIQCIASIYEKHDRQVVMCAPTGRAANRMSEATGHEARTIHRLLEFSYDGGFQKNEDEPLEGDLFVVDESSMVDTRLMDDLLKAIPPEGTLLLVGDVNQLPSVGAGNVLADIIASGAVPVAQLAHIFRQAEQSAIVTNAHKINNGEMPDTPGPEKGLDFEWISETNPEQMQRIIVDLVAAHYEATGSIDNCQVLTPMRKTALGTQVLNDVLQQRLNRNTESVQKGSVRFLLGDKVMQTRNNYNKDVYNGDIGYITGIDRDDEEIEVNFGTRQKPNMVAYEFSEIDELMLAYACTVHKSQGSEYDTIIMPVTTQHFIMLARNLFYTGVTRGKKKVTMIGSKKALNMAVRNNKIQKRYTRLIERLSS